MNKKKRKAIEEFFKPENLATTKAMFNITREEELEEARILLEQFIDDEGNLDLKKALAFQLDKNGLDKDLLHQAMRYSSKLLGEDIFEEKVKPHLEVEPYCVICQIPKTKLCEHVRGEEKIRVLIQLGRLNQALDHLERELDQEIEQRLWRAHILTILYRREEAMQQIVAAEANIHETEPLLIFKVQIIKLQLLIELQKSEEILKIEKNIKYLASNLEESDEVTYWSGRMGLIAARLAYTRGHLQLAMDPLVMAVDCFIEVGAKYELGQALAHISLPLIANNETERAHMAIEYAKQIMHDLDNPFGLLQVHHVSVMVAMLLMDHQAAIDELEQARGLLQCIEFPEIHIAQILLETKTYINLNQLDLARKQLDDGIDALERIETGRQAEFDIAIYFLRAEIAEMEDRIEDALAHYESAAKIAVEKDDDLSLLEIEANIARLSELL